MDNKSNSEKPIKKMKTMKNDKLITDYFKPIIKGQASCLLCGSTMENSNEQLCRKTWCDGI